MHRATLITTVPNLPKFILRGVVPLPRGYTFGGPGQDCPFTIKHPLLDENCPTQWQPVSYYPSEVGQDAEVASAEILAVIDRDDLPPGVRAFFQLHEEASAWSYPEPATEAILMTQMKDAVRLRATDFFGNVYEASLSRNMFAQVPGGPSGLPTGPGTILDTRTHRMGCAMGTVETHGWLDKKGPGTAEALPWFLGWQAFFSVRTGSDVVELALNVHNAFSPPKNLSDPAGHMYFKELSLVVPKGWAIMSEWPEPSMGSPKPDDNDAFYVIPLVAANEDGTMHMMAQQAEREWRLVLFEEGNQSNAQEVLNQYGWAVPAHDTAEAGLENPWCWQNEETGNYQAQRFPVPSLDPQACLERTLVEYSKIRAALASRTAVQYPDAKPYGYFHPYGVSYGGMTGGSEIFPFDGLVELTAGSVEGLLYTRALHFMYSCRQQGMIYNIKGKPTRFEDYLKDGTCDWHYLNAKWYPGYDGDYDFLNAVSTHRPAIEAAGQLPVYEPQVTREYGSYSSYYQPQDFQHYVRRTRSCRTLAWLDNDPLAKRKLEMLAEIGLMWYHDMPSNSAAGVFGHLSTEITDGGDGMTIPEGRGAAWVMDTAAAAYAVGEKSWRDRAVVRSWFEAVTFVLRSSLTPAGICQGYRKGKMVTMHPFLGQYVVCHPFEQGLLAHGMQAILKSVCEGLEGAEEGLCREFLQIQADGLARYMWRDGTGGAWTKMAVGPLDGEPFESIDEVPEDGFYGPYPEVWQIVPGMAYALADPELSNVTRTALMARVTDYAGGHPDPVEWFEGQGLKMIENRAPLLAWLQLND